MAKILNKDQLIKYIEEQDIIQNPNFDNIEGIKYDFSMSSRILKSKFGQPIDILQIPETERSTINVEPGEVVFVLTKETLNLPKNIKADLIPKRKLSHDGILTLGGLSIDPLYKGRLLVGLYNFSSSPFPLIPNKKLIAAEFQELDESEILDFSKPEFEIDDFPDDLIKLMERYRPISSQSLMNLFKGLEIKFEEMQKQFFENSNWFKQFQKSLTDQEEKIEKILFALKEEVDERKTSQHQYEQRMSDNLHKYSMNAYKTAAIVGTLGAVVMSFLIFIIQKLLEGGGQ